jgi:[ribosomal protein S18]-alanine N-acetyltransferase
LILRLPATARATGQISDRVRFNGVDGFLVEGPLGDLLWQLADPPEFESTSTANWKGYVAAWEIKDGVLYLTSFEGQVKGKMVGPEVILSGRPLPVRADWFTGRLRIVLGEVVNRPRRPSLYDLIFERGVELHLIKGRVVRSEEFKNYRIKSPDEERAIDRAQHFVWPLPRWEHGSVIAGVNVGRTWLNIVIVPAVTELFGRRSSLLHPPVLQGSLWMLSVRPTCESDLPVMIELARRSWLSAYADSAPAEFVREWLARDFEREWYAKYWRSMTVAIVEGVVLGLVQPMKDEINGLWVDPAAQGRGIGTALLVFGEAEIASAGYERAWLSCSGFNQKAKRFYLARGYRQVGSETKERAGGIREEMLVYERRVLPTPATLLPQPHE